MKLKNYILCLVLFFPLILSAQPISRVNKSNFVEKPIFYPLDYGDITPASWLKDWCVNAKNSLMLHNEAFVKGWIDGQPNTFLNEQTAYWIDGMIRMGLLLNDSELLDKAKRDIITVIEKDYLKPSSWASAVYARAILAYYYGTSDEKALDYLIRFFSNADVYGFADVTNMKPPGDARGEFIATTQPRNLVQVEAMLETYSLSGNQKVLDIALKGLDHYAGRFVGHWTGKRMEIVNPEGCYAGMDSTRFPKLPPFPDAVIACIPCMHGVTYNELAKLWGIGYLFNGKKDYLQASINAYQIIDTLHLMPHGVNSSWENLMGISPELGTETCDISDYINSNIWMYRITGSAKYGDRLERAMFNAAPAAVSDDYTHLAYLQAPNKTSLDDKFEFKKIHEPKCCNGNSARLLPNYILHMLMATNDNGLALNLYGPCNVDTKVANKKINLIIDTYYPFRDQVSIRFQNSTGKIPFYLRIPEWCEKYTIKINKKTVKAKNENGFVKLKRNWKKNDLISIDFQANVQVISGITKSNGATSSLSNSKISIPNRKYHTVERGALLFALPKEITNDVSFLQANLKTEFTFLPEKFLWSLAPIKIKTENNQLDLIPYGSTEGVRQSMFMK
ncbi:MAG: glycoside hydrolase family 127 protein [Paludibacter sp.]|nr:glycoside hydrolase family 127 protein [Paludibacter sp.]